MAMTGRLILQHPLQHRCDGEEEEEEVAEAVVGHNTNMMIGLRLDLEDQWEMFVIYFNGTILINTLTILTNSGVAPMMTSGM